VFLLSSVLLGLLSFGYGKWRDYESRQEKLEQLDLEIALRIQTMDTMCSGAENNRYSNLVNVTKVMDGDPKSSFYVRKPLFNDFENKSLATLLWQLYLLLPGHERPEIKRAIADVNVIDRQIRRVRYAAANESAPTRRAKPKTEKEQEAQDDADDIFKKDYGQAEIICSNTHAGVASEMA
jgi:hypothetical protein